MDWSQRWKRCGGRNWQLGLRTAFDHLDPAAVAKHAKNKGKSLLADEGTILNRLKVESAIDNAQAFLTVQEEFGTFEEYVWRFVDGQPNPNPWKVLDDVSAQTPKSDAMSKDRKRRGFRFVGGTNSYAATPKFSREPSEIEEAPTCSTSGKPMRRADRMNANALRWPHVLGAGAFRPGTCRVSHLLSFVQIIETHALQAFRVEEQVFRTARVDESKSLVRQFFDRAFGHVSVFSKRLLGKMLPTGTFPVAVHPFTKCNDNGAAK